MISIIIVSLSGDTERIKEEAKKQALNNFEIIEIKGISPVSRARNEGAKKAKGDVLIFLDDDISFSAPNVLSKIVDCLRKERAGAVGTGLLLPSDANWFEKRITKEVKRTEMTPPVKTMQTEDRITGVCFGIKKNVFLKVGGFNEDLVSGEDPELFYRLAKSGYKNFIISNSFVYHHAPRSLIRLIKKFYWYGRGHFQSRNLHPEWNIGPKINSKTKAVFYILIRTLFLPFHILIDSDFKTKKIELSFRPFRAISSYSSAWGYVSAFWGKNR